MSKKLDAKFDKAAEEYVGQHARRVARGLRSFLDDVKYSLNWLEERGTVEYQTFCRFLDRGSTHDYSKLVDFMVDFNLINLNIPEVSINLDDDEEVAE